MTDARTTRRSTRLRLACGTALAACLAGPALAQGASEVLVTVTDKGCEPSALSVQAGRTTFKIKNQSRRALEWEILNGVRVVEERENILPNFTQSLSATLEAGDYQMTCGLLSNPRGKLTVAAAAAPAAPAASAAPAGGATPGAGSTATASQGTPPGKTGAADIGAAVAEYKVYVVKEVDNLVIQTQSFVEAVKAGQLDEARSLYAPTRQHYERIEPVAELFDDLDKSMDVRADDFAKKERDPNFTGFHRIEKALFTDRTTAGMGPLADKLLADVKELQKRLSTLEIPAPKMEDRYSRTDLWDFQANVDGATKIVEILRPMVASRDPALVDRVQKNIGRVNEILAKYRASDGRFESYEKLTTRDRNGLKGPVTALAEDLSTLRGKLGLD